MIMESTTLYIYILFLIFANSRKFSLFKRLFMAYNLVGMIPSSEYLGSMVNWFKSFKDESKTMNIVKQIYQFRNLLPIYFCEINHVFETTSPLIGLIAIFGNWEVNFSTGGN